MTEHSSNPKRPTEQRAPHTAGHQEENHSSRSNHRGSRRRRKNRRRVERGVTSTTHLNVDGSLDRVSHTQAGSSSLNDAKQHELNTSVNEQVSNLDQGGLNKPDRDSNEQMQKGSDTAEEQKTQAKQHTQFSSPEAAPFAFVSIQTNGIHPSTARLLSLGVFTTDERGNVVDTWHVVVDPKEDPGPEHLHGLTAKDFQNAPQFGVILSKLTYALDGRTLVTHDAPRVWGFIISEAKRARRQANRDRRKNRGRRSHGRARVGRIPAPVRVVDTLATARRQGTPLSDTRLRGVARAYGLDVPSPVASLEGRAMPESERTLDDATTTLNLFAAQGGFDAVLQGAGKRDADFSEDTAEGADLAGGADSTWASAGTNANTGVTDDRAVNNASLSSARPIAGNSPTDLTEDSVGLQRSAVRVAAMEAPRPVENPGKYQRGKSLQEGMEFVVAPEVILDPDDLISAGVAAGLVYSEKVTRKTSLLVCNQPANVTPEQLVGKAMHAHRKDIPLVSDEAFLRLVESAK